MSELTTEEKIDYIYTTLKRGRRNEIFSSIFRWGRRAFVIGSMVYFYYFGAQIIQDQVQAILSSATPSISTDSLLKNISLDTIKEALQKKSSDTLNDNTY